MLILSHRFIGNLSNWRKLIRVKIKPEYHLISHAEKQELSRWYFIFMTGQTTISSKISATILTGLREQFTS